MTTTKFSKSSDTTLLAERGRPDGFSFDPALNPSNKTCSVTERPIEFFRTSPNHARKPGKGQIEALKSTISGLGFVQPIMAQSTGEIIDGHARYEAARQLGYKKLPVVTVDGLTEHEVQTLALGLNKLGERGEWNSEALEAALKSINSFDPALLAFTGFEPPEVDKFLSPHMPPNDDFGEVPGLPERAVSKTGDTWVCADQKLVCGSATSTASYEQLLGDEKADVLLTDPPYGCRIKGHVSRKHDEFLEGSGYTEDEMVRLLGDFLHASQAFLNPGSLAYMFMDSAGLYAAMTALRQAVFEHKTICVWDKQVGGMGALYRQQAEFIIVAKHGKIAHTNNVKLGKYGRNRTTVWSYPGMSQFGPNRAQLLKMHPTIKPVGLIAEAILDATMRDEIVLDPFVGSGTTLLAAHRVGRRGRGIEIDPKYVDVAIKRLEQHTGEEAVHAASGRTFAECVAAADDDRPISRVRARPMRPRV